MIELEEFLEMKRRLEKHQRDADRAAGAMESQKAELKAKYGCSTLKQADALVARKREELAELEEKIAEGMKELEKYDGAIG